MRDCRAEISFAARSLAAAESEIASYGHDVMARRVDVSNYDAPTFNAECFKEQGVEGVIIGCQREDQARADLRSVLQHQLDVGTEPTSR